MARKSYIPADYRELSKIIESCEEFHASKEQVNIIGQVKELILSPLENTIGLADSTLRTGTGSISISENTKQISEIIFSLLDKASRQKKHTLAIHTLQLSKQCLQLFQALKLFSFKLYDRSLLNSSLTYNDCEYIIDCIHIISSDYTQELPKNLQYIMHLDDLVQMLTEDAKSVYKSIIDEYKRKAIECVKWLNLTVIDTKYPEIEKSLDEAIGYIKHISDTCSNVLPRNDVHSIVGNILDALLSHILSLIVKLEDICTEDTPLLKHMMWKIFECNDLFVNVSPRQFTNNWEKLELLIDIFDNDLSGIVKMHQQHKFRDKFNVYEIRQLVKALYVDSEQRAEGLKLLV